MIRKIMRLIFMDRSGRAAAEQLRDSNERIAQAEALEEPEVTDEPETVDLPNEADDQDEVEVQEIVGEAPASDREVLMEQTMALYRKRRAEYEKLDEGVREKLTKLATEHLGDKKS
jgi:hypothetical protein